MSGSFGEEPEARVAGARRSGHRGERRPDHWGLVGLVKETGFTPSDVENGEAFGSV